MHMHTQWIKRVREREREKKRTCASVMPIGCNKTFITSTIIAFFRSCNASMEKQTTNMSRIRKSIDISSTVEHSTLNCTVFTKNSGFFTFQQLALSLAIVFSSISNSKHIKCILLANRSNVDYYTLICASIKTTFMPIEHFSLGCRKMIEMESNEMLMVFWLNHIEIA